MVVEEDFVSIIAESSQAELRLRDTVCSMSVPVKVQRLCVFRELDSWHGERECLHAKYSTLPRVQEGALDR